MPIRFLWHDRILSVAFAWLQVHATHDVTCSKWQIKILYLLLSLWWQDFSSVLYLMYENGLWSLISSLFHNEKFRHMNYMMKYSIWGTPSPFWNMKFGMNLYKCIYSCHMFFFSRTMGTSNTNLNNLYIPFHTTMFWNERTTNIQSHKCKLHFLFCFSLFQVHSWKQDMSLLLYQT